MTVKDLWEAPRKFERLALLVLVVLYVVGFNSVRESQNAIREEGESRRDQTCVIFEGQQKLEVDRLARTYDYLLTLTARQLRDPINRAVLAQLPQTESEARQDNAPPYCDEEGIGLPEPDPAVPVRPQMLR